MVYTDWLEENGEPARAEFIRVLCELAALSDDDPRRPALEDRELQLLGDHEPSWFSIGPFDARWVKWEFRRGFVAGLWGH